MTTVVGDNSENALTLSFDAASPRSADRQIMCRTFGWERNWSRTLPAFIWFNPPFFSVWLCVTIIFSFQTKESQTLCVISGKVWDTRSFFCSFPLTHANAWEERGQMFPFLFFLYLQLQTGTLSGNKRSLHAGWSRSVNWFELMLFQEKSMHFLTAAITPLTSIHQEICMR